MTVLLILNAIAAFATFIVLQWAGAKVGKPLNIVLFVASALALFYFGAYVWLLFNQSSNLGWTVVMRWISLVVWPIVWMGPAIASVVTRTNRNAMIKEAAAKLKEETA